MTRPTLPCVLAALSVCFFSATLSPPQKPGVSSPHLVQLRGALMRRLEMRDGVRRLRGLYATSHSGGVGAPTGATTSPRQELAGRSRTDSPGLKRGPVPKRRRKLHALGMASCVRAQVARSAVAHQQSACGAPEGARRGPKRIADTIRTCASRRAIPPHALRRAEGPSRRTGGYQRLAGVPGEGHWHVPLPAGPIRTVTT